MCNVPTIGNFQERTHNRQLSGTFNDVTVHQHVPGMVFFSPAVSGAFGLEVSGAAACVLWVALGIGGTIDALRGHSLAAPKILV